MIAFAGPLLFLTTVAPSLAPSLVPAQAPTPGGSRFGRAVLDMGDLDGDGVPDIAVGAPTASNGKGLILILSGKTQDVLTTWRGPKERSGFGHMLRAIQDVDGDGVDDVLVGFEFWSRTELRSGKDGAVLHTIDRAWSDVIPFGDFDGDGAGDLLVTTVHFWEVRSGRTNTLLNGRTWVRAGGRFDPIGDVDGDGLMDGVYVGKAAVLMLSARPDGDDQDEALERIQLFGAKNRQTMQDLWPAVFGAEGLTISRAAAAGDLDGDGRKDLLVATKKGGAGSIVGLSNHDRSKVLMRSYGAKPLFGGSGTLGYSMLGGVNLDGKQGDEVVFGSPTTPFGVVVVVASAGAAMARPAKGPDFKGAVWNAKWSDGGATSGVSLAAFDDMDGDRIADVLVGSSDWYWHGTVVPNGTLRLLSGRTGKEIWTVTEQRYAELGEPVEEPK